MFEAKQKSGKNQGKHECGCQGRCSSCSGARERSKRAAQPGMPYLRGPDQTRSPFGYRYDPAPGAADFRRESGLGAYSKDAGAGDAGAGDAGAPSGLGSATPSVSWSGLNFSATGTFTPCTDCRDGLEAIQVFWGTRRTDGVQVGTFQRSFPPLTAVYDSFVDGGLNSPGGATYSGNHPYYIGRPDLPASYGYNSAQGSAGSVSGCTAAPSDAPGAAALHQEAYFETVFVCLNYAGTGKDKLMNAVKWGFNNLGAQHKASPYSSSTSALVSSSPSSEFEATLQADYPAYSHT